MDSKQRGQIMIDETIRTHSFTYLPTKAAWRMETVIRSRRDRDRHEE